MKSAQILRKKIESHTLTTGLLATFHLWPDLVEISINAGFDYLIIDLEHQTYADELVIECCSIGRMMNFPVLARPPKTDADTIRQLMDRGPVGMLLPSIHTPEMMDVVREGAFMPPRGKRRPGGHGNKWVPDYNYATWKREVEEDFIFLPQIESRQAVRNAEAIAAHPLTTAIAIGPYDLSADIGCCWDADNKELQDSIGKVREAGKKAGKNMWMIGDGPTLVKRGFTFLCVTEAAMFLQNSLTALVKQVKSGAASTASPDDKPLP